MSVFDEIQEGRFSLAYPGAAGFPGVLPAGYGRISAGAPVSFAGARGGLLLYVHAGAGRGGAEAREGRFSPGCFAAAPDAADVRLEPEGAADVFYLLFERGDALLEPLLREGFFLRPRAGCRAAGLLQSFCRAAWGGGMDDPYLASGAAYQLLMELCAGARPEGARYSELVQGAAELIRGECAFLSGIDELADRLGVSKSHLIRTFSAEVGVPPGKFLQRERIDRAKLLLLNREYPVETVANMTGYAGANYFCKVFRRETGETPGEYRARFAGHPPRDLRERLCAFEGIHYV